MISPKRRTKAKGRKIEVTDQEGNAELFSSVKDVCDVLKCTNSYVYQALRTGNKIVGCKVRVVEQ